MNESRVRLSHLFIRVSNLDAAREFYVTTLGLEVLFEDEGYLRVGSDGGFHIGIEEGAPDQVGAAGIEIVVEVEDIDRRYEEMKAQGITFTQPPHDQEWGTRHAWLTDPDGYQLSIYSQAPSPPGSLPLS